MTNFHPFRCNLCKKSHSRVRIDTEKDQILTKSKSALRFGVFFWETSRKVFKGEKSCMLSKWYTKALNDFESLTHSGKWKPPNLT